MSDSGSDPESYLSEIDSRLQSIQGQLQPGRPRPGSATERRGRSGPLAMLLRRPEPPEIATPADVRESVEVSGLLEQVREMRELQARLIAAIGDLLDACETAPGPTTTKVTMDAGPFSDTDAVRAFERALGSLPGVESVAVRGYEGEDRAIVEVELEREPPTAPTP